jgi:hypothetical protein
MTTSGEKKNISLSDDHTQKLRRGKRSPKGSQKPLAGIPGEQGSASSAAGAGIIKESG